MKNPLGVFCLFAVWLAVVGGSVFVAARIDDWLAAGPSSVDTAPSSLHDALVDTAAKDAATRLSQQNPGLRAEALPDRPGRFRVTNARTGATAEVDMAGLHKLLASADEAGKLFPAVPATNAPAATAAAAPGNPFAPAVPPLPGWIPAPPGAKVTAHLPLSPDGQGGGSFLLAAPRPWADVVRFYEGHLEGSGYAVSRNEVVGGATQGIILTAASDGPEAAKRTLQLTVTQDGRGAQVAGTYGGGPSGPQ